MTRPHSPLTWSDVETAAQRLGPTDWRALQLLARLPLAPAQTLRPFIGRSGSGVYLCLQRLAARGLVASVRPPLAADRSCPRLLHLTDLGLATLSLHVDCQPGALARVHRLRWQDLLERLRALPRLLAVYELLTAFAGSREAPADLLAWEEPWRRRFQRPSLKSDTTVRLPAVVALSWKDGWSVSALLVPDPGAIPLTAFRAPLVHLYQLRALGGDVPPLLVATARVAGWERLLREVRDARRDAPLAAMVVTLEQVRAGLVPDALPIYAAGPSKSTLHVSRPRHPRPEAGRWILRLVGGPLVLAPSGAQGMPEGAPARQQVLVLEPSAHLLLETVARHPFLTVAQLGIVLGWPVDRVRRTRDALIASGLLRHLEPHEVLPGELDSGIQPADVLELTRPGLSLVAVRLGVGLTQATRYHGLAGGGPERPTRTRTHLRATLAHTIGTNGVMAAFHAPMPGRADRRDDGVREWRNAAACARGACRPDGYAVVRRHGCLQGFFLEYDRATESARDYRRKFAAYHDFRESGRFLRDYDGFPTVLVVTSGPGAEDRIVRALSEASVGRAAPLPVFLTTGGWIDGVPEGVLGRIWRVPGRRERSYWPFPDAGGAR